jgi:Subtilase family
MYETNARKKLIAATVFFVGSFIAQAQSNIQPGDFWASRDAKIGTTVDASKVRIAIWDSGVDTSLFPNQVARNADGEIILSGYDAFKNRQDTALAVLPEAVLKRQSELNEILRALDDRDSGVDSPAAKAIAKRLKKQTPAEAAEFDDVMGRWSGYVHGTGVADIALAGNPHAEFIIARMQWWHGSPPVPCWTRELADREADSIRDQLQFLVENGARVVNMSWGRAERAYLSNLKECATDMPESGRLKLARYTVAAIRAALIKGMESAPNVLFVGASGNAGSDMKTANPATLFADRR